LPQDVRNTGDGDGFELQRREDLRRVLPPARFADEYGDGDFGQLELALIVRSVDAFESRMNTSALGIGWLLSRTTPTKVVLLGSRARARWR
jgi:hypothetical protein